MPHEILLIHKSQLPPKQVPSKSQVSPIFYGWNGKNMGVAEKGDWTVADGATTT